MSSNWNTPIGYNGTYGDIMDNHSGRCLYPAGGSYANGAQLIQQYCGDDEAFLWSAYYQFTDRSGFDEYHIVNAHSHDCVAVPGGTTSVNVQLIQWPCGIYADHYWSFWSDGTGGLVIQNYNSGQVMSVRAANTSDGAAVIQYPYGPYVDQYWQ